TWRLEASRGFVRELSPQAPAVAAATAERSPETQPAISLPLLPIDFGSPPSFAAVESEAHSDAARLVALDAGRTRFDSVGGSATSSIDERSENTSAAVTVADAGILPVAESTARGLDLVMTDWDSLAEQLST